MVADYRVNQMAYYDILAFLKDSSCTGMQFQLLCFWGRHPRAKLSLYTVARVLDSSMNKLRDATTDLVEKGILIAQQNDNGLTTYALGDQRAKEYVDELGGLDWKRTMNLEKQLKNETVSFAKSEQANHSEGAEPSRVLDLNLNKVME